MTDSLHLQLLRADVLVEGGHYAEAVAMYESVARAYADAGFVLRAISVSRTIVSVVDSHAPTLANARRLALRRLVELYTGLGLAEDAEEVRRMLCAEAN